MCSPKRKADDGTICSMRERFVDFFAVAFCGFIPAVYAVNVTMREPKRSLVRMLRSLDQAE